MDWSLEHVTSPGESAEILGHFLPVVRAWWGARYAEMSAPQRLAVPAITAGRHVLVCAPTGTGKTLCAFLAVMNDLFARQASGTLSEGIDTVYISPLRALGADIARNLTGPLAEIAALRGDGAEEPRVAQRTGDTSARERARMARRPPHILITTPESLALCLAGETMRAHLRGVRRIIVDELHALAPNKRGTDLALSVERLAELVMAAGGNDPQRIGLSATIAPLERMARFLVGPERDCVLADASFPRPLELRIASVFGKTPFATTAAINQHIYDLLEMTIRANRTTLVFTNLRAATERVTFALRKRFAAGVERGADSMDALITPAQIEAHHSSLDRDARLEIERRLKAGELRCVVCSTSLELGIDIGAIDQVVLLNSPKGVARGLQRVGRSGHSLSATAKGIFVPTVPADLIEAVVTAEAMRQRAVDAVRIPCNCLDVLAQHVVGMAVQAGAAGIHTDRALAIARRTHSYATLSAAQFERVIRYVAETGGVEAERRERAMPWAKLSLSPDVAEGASGEGGMPARGVLRPLRKSLAGLYAQNVGTITQEAQVKVRIEHSDERGGVIGMIEEGFAQVLKAGDRFVLGGRCVAFARSRGMTVEVVESTGKSPTIPRWYSGTLGMEPGLARRMRAFRGKVRAIAPAGQAVIARMLTRQYQVDAETARVAAEYLHAQYRYADIPSGGGGRNADGGQLLVERVPDDGATVLIFHTMIGRAANEALARVVAYRMHERFGTPRPEEVGGGRGGGAAVVVDDYAFGVWVDGASAARRADRTLVRSLLSPARFDEDLGAAVEASELFRTQFRYTAIRAHALLHNKFGRRRFIGQLQSYAAKLHEALQEHEPDHLLLEETRRTVTEDLLSAPAARAYLEEAAEAGLRLIDLPSPSPFAFGLFAAGAAKRDTLQLADTADFLLAMYAQVRHRLAARQPANAEPTLFSVS